VCSPSLARISVFNAAMAVARYSSPNVRKDPISSANSTRYNRSFQKQTKPIRGTSKKTEYRTAALAQGHSKKEAEKIADDKLNGGTSANMSEEEILEQVRLWLGSSKRGRRPKS
jgi:hypothetical protein